MQPDEPTDEERQEELPEDNGTPFQPAAPNPDPTGAADPAVQAQAGSQLDDTHPATDTNIQPEEAYDKGVPGAAEASEPTAGNDVVDAADQAQPGETITPTTSDGERDTTTGEQPPA